MNLTNAFWITPKGDIINPDIRHIDVVIKFPSKFGETESSIKDTFEKYKENISGSFEGKAREEIIFRILKRGFIRIRNGGSRNNQKWSIQLMTLNSRNNDHLWTWARKIIDSRIALDRFADVYIHQLSNNKMTTTSLDKIASGKNIQEKKIYNESEVHLVEDYFDYAETMFDYLHEDARTELCERNPSLKYLHFEDELSESSLSRIWQYVENDKRFGIVSAFRKDMSRNENLKRHEILKKSVRSMGYGFIEMNGAYPEGGKTTTELSLFIPEITKIDIVSLGKGFNQDSVMFKSNDEFIYIGTNSYTGVNKVLSNFNFKSGRGDMSAGLKDLFSSLAKGSHKDKAFLFTIKD